MKFILSTVTPVYQGEKYLHQLVDALERLKKNLEKEFTNLELAECIFVVDDAKDNSYKVLTELADKYDWVNVLELSRNFGQHPATVAGILHSSGDWIFTLDEDLQHNPENILPLLKSCLVNNCDVMFALAKKEVHSSIIRDKFSLAFKRLVGFLSSNPYVPVFSSFRCMRGSIARAAAASNSIDTYFDVSLTWFTTKIGSMKMDIVDFRNQEGNSSSGYSLWSLIRHGKRLILSSKLKFLRIFFLFGILAFLFSLAFSCQLLFQLFNGTEIEIKGWASTIISIYFFGGVSCLLLGVLVESLSEILLKIKGKPSFLIVDRSRDKSLLKTIEEK